MRLLTIFLAFIMLLPFGAQHGEISEKNEVERIEYFSESERLLLNRQNKKIIAEVRKTFRVWTFFFSKETAFPYDSPAQLNQKIYLFQRSLLL